MKMADYEKMNRYATQLHVLERGCKVFHIYLPKEARYLLEQHFALRKAEVAHDPLIQEYERVVNALLEKYENMSLPPAEWRDESEE